VCHHCRWHELIVLLLTKVIYQINPTVLLKSLMLPAMLLLKTRILIITELFQLILLKKSPKRFYPSLLQQLVDLLTPEVLAWQLSLAELTSQIDTDLGQ